MNRNSYDVGIYEGLGIATLLIAFIGAMMWQITHEYMVSLLTSILAIECGTLTTYYSYHAKRFNVFFAAIVVAFVIIFVESLKMLIAA